MYRSTSIVNYAYLQASIHLFPPLFPTLASGVNINPATVPMPGRKLPIATLTAMLHILQPPDAKRDTAKARDRTDAQGPGT